MLCAAVRRGLFACALSAGLAAPAAANPLLDKAQANLDVVGVGALAGALLLLALVGIVWLLMRVLRAQGRLLGRNAQRLLAEAGTECLVRRRGRYRLPPVMVFLQLGRNRGRCLSHQCLGGFDG